MKKRKSFKGRNGGNPRRRTTAGGGWIFGLHAVRAALENPARSHQRLLATEPVAAEISEWLSGPEPGAADRGVPAPEIMTRDDIAAFLPRDAVHQGIALLADPLPEMALAEICDRLAAADHAVVVVLDRVTDPHNVGAVLRSAAVFGAAAVVVSERGAPEATGTMAKAASGALEVVPLIRETNLSRALDALKSAGFWCAGLDADADTTLAEAKLSGKTALVLGAEGAGLRRLVRERCDFLVRIPAPGALSSLNVSNAAAIALHECVREPVHTDDATPEQRRINRGTTE
jgi:23S rRNA (guanosine2251-2'-O)-methyltransferase